MFLGQTSSSLILPSAFAFPFSLSRTEQRLCFPVPCHRPPLAAFGRPGNGGRAGRALCFRSLPAFACWESFLRQVQNRGRCFSWRMHWATTALAVLHVMSPPSHDENSPSCRPWTGRKEGKENSASSSHVRSGQKLWLVLPFVAGVLDPAGKERKERRRGAISPSAICQPELTCVLCCSTATVGDLLK